ncbi:VRR-NUC domain-containing protein [Xylocopilactobacillus apis]|uniref:VRR-NUC domain-containing protein n=1 Tax=Xylocopilactobacillus apis TaxID=2932183 RepID=A0AAU9CSD6_9LACO|nr:VRR-NUC domain-containing protein [Xylocopilactobacillus apis]BDR56894.1 hypothetical protein KIMC2_14560 [Xylocopilactobacillus apis]
MQRENDIERYLVKQMKDLGALCLKWTSPGTRGVPDRIVIYANHVYFVELKAPGKKPRADQVLMIEKIKDRGGEVFVISTKEEVKRFVDNLEDDREEADREYYDWIDERDQDEWFADEED